MASGLTPIFAPKAPTPAVDRYGRPIVEPLRSSVAPLPTPPVPSVGGPPAIGNPSAPPAGGGYVGENLTGPIDLSSLTSDDLNFLHYMAGQPGMSPALTSLFGGSAQAFRDALSTNRFQADPYDIAGGMHGYNPGAYNGQLRPYFNYQGALPLDTSHFNEWAAANPDAVQAYANRNVAYANGTGPAPPLPWSFAGLGGGGGNFNGGPGTPPGGSTPLPGAAPAPAPAPLTPPPSPTLTATAAPASTPTPLPGGLPPSAPGIAPISLVGHAPALNNAPPSLGQSPTGQAYSPTPPPAPSAAPSPGVTAVAGAMQQQQPMPRGDSFAPVSQPVQSAVPSGGIASPGTPLAGQQRPVTTPLGRRYSP